MAGNPHGPYHGPGTGDLQLLCLERLAVAGNVFHMLCLLEFVLIVVPVLDMAFQKADSMYSVRTVHP